MFDQATLQKIKSKEDETVDNVETSNGGSGGQGRIGKFSLPNGGRKLTINVVGVETSAFIGEPELRINERHDDPREGDTLLSRCH